MAKYRLLNKNGYSNSHFEWGLIYDESYMGQNYSVKVLVTNYPHDWELIKEEPMCTEKTIKLSLEQAKKMYGKSPEMDELLLANFSKEELTKKELPKSWSEIGDIYGYYLESGSDYGKVKSSSFVIDTKTQKYYHRFATEKQARSALAMAQLSQLMAVYNDGWEPNWKGYMNKYIIHAFDGRISAQFSLNNHYFLAFKSAELRDEFLKNFEPLIKEYFMID